METFRNSKLMRTLIGFAAFGALTLGAAACAEDGGEPAGEETATEDPAGGTGAEETPVGDTGGEAGGEEDPLGEE